MTRRNKWRLCGCRRMLLGQFRTQNGLRQTTASGTNAKMQPVANSSIVGIEAFSATVQALKAARGSCEGIMGGGSERQTALANACGCAPGPSSGVARRTASASLRHKMEICLPISHANISARKCGCEEKSRKCLVNKSVRTLDRLNKNDQAITAQYAKRQSCARWLKMSSSPR